MTNTDWTGQRDGAQPMATRYDDATTCECGALVECLDGGGYRYWAHVKRMRIDFDHAAVPALRMDALDRAARPADECRDIYPGRPVQGGAPLCHKGCGIPIWRHAARDTAAATA